MKPQTTEHIAEKCFGKLLDECIGDYESGSYVLMDFAHAARRFVRMEQKDSIHKLKMRIKELEQELEGERYSGFNRNTDTD